MYYNYKYKRIFVKTFKLYIMAKKQVSWQISPETLDKVKKIAKKSKVAVQLAAEELILKGLEK